ncbi:hypothetical protein GCM10023187_34610 [Nibrella viscosa]|uniref:Uncharacterized protein n=1 Tax=Nibrella viscosa TaxID=1084524 RepID=A0ABP8KMS7_9BACT
MKNILIITIGTRDVQTTEAAIRQAITEGKIQIESIYSDKEKGKDFITKIRLIETDAVIDVRSNINELFPEYYIFPSPRNAGLELAKLSEENKKWLVYPLIDAPLKWLKKELVKVDYVLTVFTNQNKAVAGFHWKDDTLYFNDLIKTYLLQHPTTTNSDIKDYPIEREPINIDFQYEHFERQKGGLLNTPVEEVRHIFLLAQGGIDQINTALTLKLIEHFPGKVRYLQQPEDQEVAERKFPRKFIRNLNKAKAEELLKRYDFHAVQVLIYDKKPQLLAQLGDNLRNLHVKEAEQCYKQLLRAKYSHPTIGAYWESVDKKGIYKIRQELLFLNALIEKEQSQYNETLLRLRTLGEVLLGPNVIDYLKITDLTQNASFGSAIRRVDGLQRYLMDKQSMPDGGWIPDYKTLRNIYNYRYLQCTDEKPVQLTRLTEQITCFDKLRNKLIHSALPVTRNDLENALMTKQTSLDQLIIDLRTFFGLANGKEIFDTIRDEIIHLLSETFV